MDDGKQDFRGKKNEREAGVWWREDKWEVKKRRNTEKQEGWRKDRLEEQKKKNVEKMGG